MKVKSSNKKSILLLLVLSLLVIILVVLSGNGFDISESSNKKGTLNLPHVNQKTPLSLIEIVVSEKNYQKLEKYKNRALNTEVISAKDKKYVSATIIYEGKKYKADIRLKGDWTDHLKGDKWSFRVKLKGDKTIRGMRKFSIHHPMARNYINEWAYQKLSKKENLIGLRYDFIEGVIHIKKQDDSGYTSKNVGIYAIEETFDKRMLENNGRKESIIIKFTEEYWWRDVKKRIEAGKNFGIKWDKFYGIGPNDRLFFPTRVFSESKVLEDSQLHTYFILSKKLIYELNTNKLSVEDVFNVRQLAMHSALANLFGAFHGDYIINHRFYYNPITSKLEPITFDGDSGQRITEYHYFRYTKKEDTIYFKALITALEKVSKKEYLEEFLTQNNEEITKIESILKKEFQFSELKLKNYYSNQDVLKETLKKLKRQYLSQNINNKNSSPIKINNYKEWELKNSSISPIRNSIFTLKRIDPLKSSYTKIADYSNAFQERKSVSFKVKTTNKGDLFAIRIQGEYPERVDAVFNLSTGKVVGVKKIGLFKEESATIKKLKNGWYLCTLVTKPSANLIKVIIGTTSGTNDVLSWEHETGKNNEILIDLHQN